MEKTKEEKKGLFFRFINGVEVIGNKLPHPFYLFTILIVVAIVLSVIFAGVSVTYESASSKGTGGEIVTVTIKNLLNKETINYVTQNLYSIYYNFSPMMMMGLLMLSIGLAEQVGLFGAFIKRTIAGVRPAFVFAMYEKDGLPLEKVLKNIIVVRFIRPSVRKYQVENMYEKKQRIVRKKGGRERVKKKK